MTIVWERRPTEGNKAYAAFSTYRDLGPDRSLHRAMEAAGAHPGAIRQWERWSSGYAWVARCAAFDAYIDRQALAKAVKDRIRRQAEQARLGQAMQGVAGQGLAKLAEQVRSGQAKLKAVDVAQLAKAGVDIERIAEGDPTERLALTGADGGPLEIRVVDVLGMPKAAPEPDQA